MFWMFLLFAQAASSQQTQIDRGEALFLDAQNGCSTCHALKGKGTAVGPDLTGIGRVTPQAIAMAVRSTVTQYVEVVKIKDGETYPAMFGPKDGDKITLFDLSKNPPEKKVVATSEFTRSGNDKWKHPPAAAKISNESLADIVAYIRYVASGTKKAVDPSEVQ